jgi:hypothetical protein
MCLLVLIYGEIPFTIMSLLATHSTSFYTERHTDIAMLGVALLILSYIMLRVIILSACVFVKIIKKNSGVRQMVRIFGTLMLLLPLFLVSRESDGTIRMYNSTQNRHSSFCCYQCYQMIEKWPNLGKKVAKTGVEQTCQNI